MTNSFQPRTCFYCLAPEGARLKLDKRGNPYLSCSVCGTFAFLRTPTAFSSLGLMQSVADHYGAVLQDFSHPEHAAVVAKVAESRRELTAARSSSGVLLLSDNAAAAVRSGSESPDYAARTSRQTG